MGALDDIALRYGTDKASSGHGYCQIYEKLFKPLRSRPIKLLELGVFKGASLRMWTDYFHPDSMIVGIDINPSCTTFKLPDNVKIFCSDQANIPPVLQGWRPDIVIDDASHCSSKTIASFRAWFPVLAPGGIYAVEDVTTSYSELYGEHQSNRDPDQPPCLAPNTQTAMQFLRRLADEVVGGYGLAQEFQLGFPISWLCFYPDLAVMQKEM